MAVGGIRTGTEGLAALKTRWDAVFRTAPNEESVIIKDFDSPTGVERIDNKLYIRVVPTITPYQLTSAMHGAENDGYHTGSITALPVDPQFWGAIVQLPDNLKSNLGSPDFANLEAAYRKQGLAAINAKFDAVGAALGSGLSTLKGPGNFDKTNLLDAINAVVTAGKDHIQIGTDRVYVKYHPTQWKHLMSIAEIANAYARGDAANPNVKGVVMDAWGATFAESGNVLFTGGVYYNLIHLKSAFVFGWNLKPMVKPMQDFEFSSRMVIEGEGGAGEIFDGDGCAFRSN